jgi:hypothetical protein
LELAVSHYEQALERAAATNQGEARRGELLIGLGEAQSRAGRAGQARASFEEAGAIATANEMLKLADRAGHRESALQARNFKVTDLLGAGDMAGFDREREAYAAACRQHPMPAFRWYIPLWTATHATINGALDEAARLAARARAEGSQAGDQTAELFWRNWLPAIAELTHACRVLGDAERARDPLPAPPAVQWPHRHCGARRASVRAGRPLPRSGRPNRR